MSLAAPKNLRCEYRVNPLGIDDARPRLSWEVNDRRQDARQAAYQIVVEPEIWDSGKVASEQSIHVAYGGPALSSRQRLAWRVRTWDAADQGSDWSQAAWWEMGLLSRADWVGLWIGSPIVGGPYSIPPAPYLRREFMLDEPVAHARLYATALGLYEFEINGRRVGEDCFTPGRTEYHRRVPYHTYDVTELLKPGPNACGAILGDGWYCGHLHSDPRQTYGDRPRLLAQLEIRLVSGTEVRIVTDGAWQAGQGPIRSSDLLMGEDYDARLEIGGWGPAVCVDDPGIEIVAHRAPPVRRIQEVKPVAAPTVSANKRRWLFDLGQNVVGRVRLKVRGPAGKVIDLRHAEMLDKDGKPYTLSLRTARAIDHYTTRGGGEEVYEPHFTFHGFRYVEVRDYPGTPTIDDLAGIVLHSDTPPTGEFACSDSMLNQLQSNIRWSQKGNFLDIPTDCPQRDERLGWTGDAQIFAPTAAFNMEVANFFTKWLTDMADAQGPDGRIPSVVPDVKSIYGEGGPAWADAAVICPWTIYRCYGDERILRSCYAMMSRFMKFLHDHCVNFIRADDHWKWKGYGDWLNMGAQTPADLIGTAYYAHCADLMAQIAGILGRREDAEAYRRLCQNIRDAFTERFAGRLTTQTACVLALHFDLLPEPMRGKVLDHLVADIQSRHMHLSTGFVGTPHLNHVLARFGRLDIAYALLMQKTFPSWLYPITQGATTMWERWDAWTHEKGFSDTGMNSFNHYAYGAIGQWMYSVIGGIDLLAPGYKKILIHPRPGGGVTWAKTALQSMYGRIECNWEISGGRLRVTAVVPPNTTAVVRVGAGAEQSIGAGRYDFEAAEG